MFITHGQIRRNALRLLAGALLSFFVATAFGQRRERTVDTWRPTHYDVSLSFNDSVSEISAARTEINLSVLAQTLATIDLDFGDLPIDSVQVNKTPARFERTPNTLNIFLPQAAKRGDALTVSVSYHGHPK